MTASKLSNSNFFSTVKKKKLKIGVIGLGYVGLPLAIEFSKKYPTVGFDKDENRINELINGNDKTLQISAHDLNTAKNLKLIFDEKNIASCNIYIVTIPTPVDKFNKPDLYPLSSASKTVGKMLKKNDIVIYESTVYPGATEEFCIPILEKEWKTILKLR